VSVPLLGADRRCEVKVRGSGFRKLYDWIEGNDVLIVRSDRKQPLVIVRMKFAAEIAAAAERNKSVK
jgi:hypothetical protein